MTTPLPFFTRISPALLALLAGSPFSPCAASIERSVSKDSFAPVVTVSATPPSGTRGYAVSDSIGAGALPTEISHDGFYDPATSTLKWGPFTDDQPRALNYRLSGTSGSVELAATASYDGLSSEVDTLAISLPDPSSTFYGQQFLDRPRRDFIYFPINPTNDGDSDGFTEFARYAFGLSEGAVQPEDLIALEPVESWPPAVSVHALINTAPADVDFSLQVSEDLLQWTPVSTAFPDLDQSRRPVSGASGLDQLVLEPVPINAADRLFFRLEAAWLSTE